MKTRFTIFICMLWLLGIITAHAYTPVTRPELSNLCVRDIKQDANGYIWIATANGLCRSFGTEYEIFFGQCDENEDLHTIPANSVSALHLDKDGWLFVATNMGICALEKDSKIFHRFSLDGKRSHRFAAQGFIEYADRLLCYGDGGLYEIDKQSLRLSLRVKMKGAPVISAVKTRDGRLWLTNGSCLLSFDSRLAPAAHIKLDSKKRIRTLGTSDRSLLIGSTSGVSAMNLSDHSIRPTPIGADTEVNHILDLHNGSIIISTSNRGVLVYNPATGQLSKKYHNIDFSETGAREINSVFCDRDNNFWLATFARGERLITNRPGMFNTDHKLIKAFRNEFITRIAPAPDGHLWVGTRYHGLVTIDAEGQKTYFDRTNHPDLKDYSHDFVQEMVFDSAKRLWVGYNNGLLVFITRNLPEPSLSLVHKFPSGANIVSMAEDKNGNMWVGTDDRGLYVLDPKFKLVTFFTAPQLQSNNITRIIPYDHNTMLVAAYTDKLYLINTETFEVQNFKHSDHPAWSHIIDLMLDRDKNLWIGTYHHGLFRIDAKTQQLRPCINNQAIDIVAMTQDAKGNIWASSSYGIYHLDESGRFLDSFLKSDGLGGNQFHEKCVAQASDGSILFGGNSGIEQISPLVNNSHSGKPLPVLLRGLWRLPDFSPALSGTQADMDEAAVDNITLNHRDNSISIDYFAVSYDGSSDVDYAYILQGRDKDFIYAGKYAKASYSDLSPGIYTFYAKVRKKGTDWQAPVKLLTVRVKPSPWLSLPAIIAYIIILITLLVIINRNYLRIKLIKQKYALSEERINQEKRITDNRISFFTNISHELRTPLTLICGPAKYLRAHHNSMSDERVNESLDFINCNINRLLTLINQLLNFRRVNNETLPLKVARADMAAQLQSLSKLYTLYATENRMKVNLIVPSDQALMLTYDADKVEKIVSNLLINAIKYSDENSTVTLRLELVEKPHEIEGTNNYTYAQISVVDTGHGVKEEDIPKLLKPFKRLLGLEEQKKTEGFGIGLHFVSHLVKEHKGVLRMTNNPGGGMTFAVIIPVSDEAFEAIEFQGDTDTADVEPDVDTHIEYNFDEMECEEGAPKILIVDDNRSLNNFLAALFCDRFKVLQAGGGEEAYEMAIAEYPDIIISDVLMDNDMDGFNFCRRIKANSSTSHIPVLLLTAKTLDEHRMEGYNCGADAYLCKPFNPDVLIARVNNLMAKQSQNASLIIASAGVSDAGSSKYDELSPLDKKFLDKLYAFIEESLDNCELNVNMLGRELGFSRTNFYRKVKALTGVSPNDLLRVYRLNRAAELLLTREYTVGEVGDRTGFANQSHFSSLFKKHFGVSPRTYVTNHFNR